MTSTDGYKEEAFHCKVLIDSILPNKYGAVSRDLTLVIVVATVHLQGVGYILF